MKKLIALLLMLTTAAASGAGITKTTATTHTGFAQGIAQASKDYEKSVDWFETSSSNVIIEKEPDVKIIERENDKPPKRRPGGRRPVQRLEKTVQ